MRADFAPEMVQDLPMQDSLALLPIAPVPAGARWRTEAMRSHESPRLIHIAKGQGRITVAGLTSGYGPNNLVFVPARTMYGYEAGPTVHGVMISIPRRLAADWPEAPAHLRLRDVASQKEMSQHIDNLEREVALSAQDEPDVAARHARAALCHIGLLAVAFENAAESHVDRAQEGRTDSMPARIAAAYTDLVERDFRKHMGVAGYAGALGITPTHLTRCCKQSCGKSALTLLNDRVLYEARLLLRASDTPVNAIARSLGFASAAYFTRSFQTATGQTPSAFRRGDTAR